MQTASFICFTTMPTFFLFLLLPAIANPALRIIGGSPASITDYPYQLSVRRHGSHICGATILSPKIAISAAHCFKVAGPYSVKAGSDLLWEGGTVVHIEQVIIHPKHRTDTNDFDVALLFLSSNLQFGDKIRPVELPQQGDSIREGMIGHVSGWGSISKSMNVYSGNLRAVEVPVWGKEKCRNVYLYSLTDRMFCAGLSNGGRDACKGDSGGPFVVQGTLFGVVSFGLDCAQPGFPGIYTSVPSVRDYIKEYAGL